MSELSKILNKQYSISDVANFLEHDIGVSREYIKLMINPFLYDLFKIPVDITKFDDWLISKFDDYIDGVSMSKILLKHFSKNQVEALKILIGVTR